MNADRRRHPRVTVDVPVQVIAQDATIDGRLRDISADATLVEAETSCAVGSEVTLDLQMPDGGAHLRLCGTVIRVDVVADTSVAMAVLFTDLPPAAATEIDLFMSRQ